MANHRGIHMPDTVLPDRQARGHDISGLSQTAAQLRTEVRLIFDDQNTHTIGGAERVLADRLPWWSHAGRRPTL